MSTPPAAPSPPRLRRPSTLKWRLAGVGALLIALAVALTVGLSLSSAGLHGEQLASDLSLAQTRKLARIVSGRLVARQILLRKIGDSRTARDWRNLTPTAARDLLEGAAELSANFDTLALARPDGEVLAARDAEGVRTPRVNLADRAYFQATLKMRRALISDPLVGRMSNEPIVVFTQPVFDDAGVPVAVLTGGLHLRANRPLEAIVVDEGEDPSHIVITDSRGRILAEADPQWLMRDAAEQPALAAPMARWKDMGRPVDPGGLTLNTPQHLVSAVGIPAADWLLVQSLPRSAVMGGVQAARQRAIWTGALVALLGGLTLLACAHLLLRPLRQLESVTRALGRGLVPPREAWPRAGGEIGALAAALREAVAQRAAADAEGQRLLALLQAVMGRSPVGIAFTRDRSFEMVNRPYEAVLGYPRGGLTGKPARIIFASQSEYDELGPQVAECFTRREPFDGEFRMLRHDGSAFWGRLQGSPVKWDDPNAGTVWALQDVTAQRSEREDLAWLSTHDALTELVNRAEFERRLAQACNDRREQETAMLFIDLDRFKAVNDNGGHAAGDAMLVAVARTIEAQVRGRDTVARLGGDEFAVLLPDCHARATLQVAEKIRSSIDALRLTRNEQEFSVGASIGAVQLDDRLGDVAAIMAAADAACYDAKHSGRNAVRLHNAPRLRAV